MTIDQKIALSEVSNSLNLSIGFQTVTLSDESNGSIKVLSLPRAEFAADLANTLKEQLVYRRREREFGEICKILLFFS